MHINRVKNCEMGGIFMVVTKPADIRKEQKKYFSIAYQGEPVIVSRPRNENVVVISEDEYNRLLALGRLSDFREGLISEVSDETGAYNTSKTKKRIIGIAEGVKFCAEGYDFDEPNEEISKMFGLL